ncbi:hypothetical protein HanHA89_Chr17g0727261 [Helianthus annuus]|nr:hypothetical protein HanHA89_Chr17g0727261 [Helianthus annuus]
MARNARRGKYYQCVDRSPGATRRVKTLELNKSCKLKVQFKSKSNSKHRFLILITRGLQV